MSAMTSNQDATTKRTSAGQDADQGESKKASVGDKACSSDAYEHPPTRRGIIVNLVVESADKFVDFMGKTAGAREYFRFPDDNGKILHLALDIDGVAVYVEELGNSMDTGAIATPHAQLHLNSDDPVAMAKKLVEAGAKELTKCEQQFWGALYGQYLDPFGQIWSVSNSTNTFEDVPEDLARKVVPFVSVRDATAYLTFLTKAFAAESLCPPSKDPTGKIMCAQMKLNGGIIMIADHCGMDAGKEEPSVTVSYELPAGKAAPLAETFQAHGGEIMEEPTMQFWGQVWGRCKDAFGQPWGLCEAQVCPPPSEEDMAVSIKLGAKYDWKYTWGIQNVPKMHCYGEVRSCLTKGPAISKEMGTMIPAAFEGAAKAGVPPVGPAMTIYFTWDPAENGLTRMTSGPTVAGGGPSPTGDGMGVREAGGCECATVVHTGPYEELMKTYGATFEWIAAKGYQSCMPVIEVYENDCSQVDPAKLRTKICIPIVPKVGATAAASTPEKKEA